MTTRRRIYALIIAPFLLTPLLAACPATSQTPSGMHTLPPQPKSSHSPNSQDCGYSWNPCPSSAAKAPIPSADAGVPGAVDPLYVLNTCHLYLNPPATGGITVTDGIHLDGSVYIKCSKAPRTQTLIIRLQKKDPVTHGWIDEAPIYVSLKIPGVGTPQFHTVTSLCYPGTWSMDIQVSGIGTDGIPFTAPRPGKSGRTPEYRTSC